VADVAPEHLKQKRRGEIIITHPGHLVHSWYAVLETMCGQKRHGSAVVTPRKNLSLLSLRMVRMSGRFKYKYIFFLIIKKREQKERRERAKGDQS